MTAFPKGVNSMICPYCEQGVVQEAKMKKSGKRIFICEECDTVWEREVNSQIGVGFETYMNSKGYEASWDELEILI